MLSDTFLLEAPEEPIDDAVLLRRVGGDEFLTEPAVVTGLTKAAALQDEAIVTPQHRHCRRLGVSVPRGGSVEHRSPAFLFCDGSLGRISAPTTAVRDHCQHSQCDGYDLQCPGRAV